MQKNSITNKITPCCGLPFSVIYWWVSNLTLNTPADRQYLLTQISQNGTLSIDGWKVLINSGTLEADASLTKAEFLAWFDCGKQPNCEQLKLIIEGYKVGNWTPETELPLNLATIDKTVNGTNYVGNVYTKEHIDNIQIGGRNLLLNSNTDIDVLPLHGIIANYSIKDDITNPSKKIFRATNIVRQAYNFVFFIPFYNSPKKFSGNLREIPLTISFYIRTNNSQFLNYVNQTIDSNWKKVSFQYTWHDSNLHFSLIGAGLQWFEIHSIKIEKGNKATDWTPAPEDKQDNLQTITDNVGIGTTSPSEKLEVNGNVKAIAFLQSSLRKLKENILPFESSGLDLISKLDIVTYDRIDKFSINKIGIIADDSPEEFLSERKDAVDLYNTIFIQIKAIQELKAEIDKLKVIK